MRMQTDTKRVPHVGRFWIEYVTARFRIGSYVAPVSPKPRNAFAFTYVTA